MRATLQKLLLATLIITALAACKKTNDRYSTTRLLTERPWVIVRLEERDGNEPWTNTFPYWDQCEKDDQWIFRSDMSMELNEGYMACSPNYPHQVLDEVSWYYSDNETKLIVDGISYRIDQLDGSTMVLSTTSPNLSYEARITFRH